MAEERALEAVDSVAERLIELASPFRLGLAGTREEVESVYRLRYEVAIAMGWARPADFPDGQERDEDDEGATYVVAWDEDELAAAQRLVFPTPGRRLPAEKAFDLDVEPRGEVVDVGRSALAPRYRGDPRHLLLLALQARSWIEWRRRGFRMALGVFTTAVVQIYRDVGLEVEQLAPARYHWGEERFPVRIDAAAAADRLTARWGEERFPVRIDAAAAAPE